MVKYVETQNYYIAYGVEFNINSSVKEVSIFDTFEAAKEYAIKCIEVFTDVSSAKIDVIICDKNSNKMEYSKYIWEIKKEYLN